MNNKQNSIETLFAKPIVNCYYNSTVEEEDNETEYIEKEDYDEDEYEEEDYEKDDLDLNPDQTMGNKYFNDWFVKNNKAYVNKYKKRGKIYEKNSRPYNWNKYYMQTFINTATEQHQIVDFIPKLAYNCREPGKKNLLHGAIMHKWKPKINKQCPRKTKKLALNHFNLQPRFIHLSEYRKGLYLGNIAAVEDDDLLNELGIDLIINLSTYKKFRNNIRPRSYSRAGRTRCLTTYLTVKWKTTSCKNFKLPDTRTITYKEFHEIFQQIYNIIDKLGDTKKVLIVCDKGVNRSVAVAVAYDIFKNGNNFTDSYDYLEQKKNKKYKYWSSLNNLRFSNILKCFSQNYAS